jgi:hypothetical protein
MAQAWRDEVNDFQCAECGALYLVAIVHLSSASRDEAICDVCQKVMNEWRGTAAPAYTLKSRYATN